MADAIRWLLNHQIHVHSIEQDCGTELDFGGEAGDTDSVVMEAISRAGARQHREATIAVFRYRRQHGMAYTKNVPMGHRRIRWGVGASDIWDETECAQIRRMAQMYDEGMTVGEIATAFFREGQARSSRTSKGRIVPWVSVGKDGRLSRSKIVDAIRWYKEVRRQGYELGDMNCPPMYLGKKRACPPLSTSGVRRSVQTEHSCAGLLQNDRVERDE